jgi:predicted nucleic acid-binding protein
VKYLLDTCALSEFTKPQPDAGLLAWLRATPEQTLHVSALTLGEIQQGVSRLPASVRRQRLQLWLDTDICVRFAGRMLPADAPVCLLWGQLRAQAAEQGSTLPVIDALIGATAVAHGLVLVTRNERDFAHVPGLQLSNPWEA